MPSSRGRDTLIAVVAGGAILGFVAWAVLSLSRTAASSGGVVGVIVRKDFVAAPETQVTVGRGGVSSREIAGDYILFVRVDQEHGKVYRVHVNATDYGVVREGQRYYFIRPRAAH